MEMEDCLNKTRVAMTMKCNDFVKSEFIFLREMLWEVLTTIV